MGRSASAKLMYGFHLGGEEVGWQLEGIGEWDYLEAEHLPWLTEEQREGFDDLNFNDVVELLETRLLRELAGFDNTYRSGTNFHERRAAAWETVGARFESHGYEYGSTALVLGEAFTADWSAPSEIDPTALRFATEDVTGNLRLLRALEVLAIKPRQERAAWLLTAEYS